MEKSRLLWLMDCPWFIEAVFLNVKVCFTGIPLLLLLSLTYTRRFSFKPTSFPRGSICRSPSWIHSAHHLYHAPAGANDTVQELHCHPKRTLDIGWIAGIGRDRAENPTVRHVGRIQEMAGFTVRSVSFLSVRRSRSATAWSNSPHPRVSSSSFKLI